MTMATFMTLMKLCAHCNQYIVNSNNVSVAKPHLQQIGQRVYARGLNIYIYIYTYILTYVYNL